MVNAPAVRQRTFRRLTVWIAVPLAVLWVYCKVSPIEEPRGDLLTTHRQFSQVADRYDRAMRTQDWDSLAAMYENSGRAAADIDRFKKQIAASDGIRVVGCGAEDVASLPLLGTIGSSSLKLHTENGFIPVKVNYVWSHKTGWKVKSAEIQRPII
jgi:hypothetical protein